MWQIRPATQSAWLKLPTHRALQRRFSCFLNYAYIIQYGTLKPAAVHFNKSHYLRKDAACRKGSSHRLATAHSPASATTRASTHSGSPGGWKSVRDGGALHTCPRDDDEHADRSVYTVSTSPRAARTTVTVDAQKIRRRARKVTVLAQGGRCARGGAVLSARPSRSGTSPSQPLRASRGRKCRQGQRRRLAQLVGRDWVQEAAV